MKKVTSVHHGLSLAAKLLEQKLRNHQKGEITLTTQELLQIHTALWKEKPLAEYVLLTLSKAFTFLDSIYIQKHEPACIEEIRKFLVAFLQYQKQEFAQMPTLRKEVTKLP